MGVVVIVILAAMLNIGGCNGPRLISHDEEIRMGRQAAEKFERENGGRSRDQRVIALTNSVGARIGHVAVASPYPDYPYEFRTLANNQVNANAFPGGVIYLWSGLFPTVNYDPDQLAWVAGHEAAHIARQHSVRRIERTVGYDLIIQLILGNDTAGKIASAVAGMTLQSYGRDQELEADLIGAQFAKQANYDPTAAIPVLEAFNRIQGKDPGNLELLFASHPGNTEREDRVKAYLRQQGWSGKYFKP
jgi:predicted Zn-dependent protease